MLTGRRRVETILHWRIISRVVAEIPDQIRRDSEPGYQSAGAFSCSRRNTQHPYTEFGWQSRAGKSPDNGEGLTLKNAKRLLTPYYTNKQTAPGWSCNRAIRGERHKVCTNLVASEPGEGIRSNWLKQSKTSAGDDEANTEGVLWASHSG